MTEKLTKTGVFQKGADSRRNMNGRPKKPEVEELRKALRIAAKEMGGEFIISYVKRAYTSDPMAIALLKKLVPDLTETDLGGDMGLDVVVMTTKEAVEYHRRKLALYEAEAAVKDGIAEE